MKYFLFMILSVFFCTSASAERSPAENEYISSVFNGSPPPIKKILIKGELKIGMKSIMGSTYRKLRIKYWEKDLKTLFPKKSWKKLHLQIIYYGREVCTAKSCYGLKCKICKTCYPNRRSPVKTKKA